MRRVSEPSARPMAVAALHPAPPAERRRPTTPSETTRTRPCDPHCRPTHNPQVEMVRLQSSVRQCKRILHGFMFFPSRVKTGELQIAAFLIPLLVKITSFQPAPGVLRPSHNGTAGRWRKKGRRRMERLPHTPPGWLRLGKAGPSRYSPAASPKVRSDTTGPNAGPYRHGRCFPCSDERPA